LIGCDKIFSGASPRRFEKDCEFALPLFIRRKLS